MIYGRRAMSSVLHSAVHCGTGMHGLPPQQLSLMNAINVFIVANCTA
jgi:hypothetical protein